MKLPKEVIIAGRTYKVILNKNKTGASFNGNKALIEIGGKYPSDIPMLFLHEVMEAVLTERGNRYSCYTEGNEYLFSFTHKEFENFVMDVRLTLREILK